MSLGEKVLACDFTSFYVVKKIFLKKFFHIFFGTPFRNFFFRSLKFHIFIPFYDYHCFWTQKCPLEAFNKGGHIVPPPCKVPKVGARVK